MNMIILITIGEYEPRAFTQNPSSHPLSRYPCLGCVSPRVLLLSVGWLWPAPQVRALMHVWSRAAPVVPLQAAPKNGAWTITTAMPPAWSVEVLLAHESPNRPLPAVAWPWTTWTWRANMYGSVTSLTRWEGEGALATNKRNSLLFTFH